MYFEIPKILYFSEAIPKIIATIVSNANTWARLNPPFLNNIRAVEAVIKVAIM